MSEQAHGSPGRTAILEAAARVMTRERVTQPSLEAVAQELSCDVETIAASFDSRTDLAREVMADAFEGVAAAVTARVEGARDGADALTRMVSAYVTHFLPRIELFRLAMMTWQIDGDEAFGIDDAFMRARIIPAVNDPLDRVEELLARDRGMVELPGGLNPRRMAFVGMLMGLGIMTIRGKTARSGRALKHDDDALIRESSRMLGGAVSSLRQLSALNRASTELSAMRSESALLEAMPRLLSEALDLDGPCFCPLAADGSLEGEAPALAHDAHAAGETRTRTGEGGRQATAVPVRCEGAPAGVIHGLLRDHSQGADERDVTRVETLASMIGLALANVRLYEGLQAQVAARTRRLEQAQAALVQSEKMAALGDLVAGIAHEINTPIASVLSSQQTLGSAVSKMRTELGPDTLQRPLRAAEQSSDNIAVAARRVSDIVTQLRRFARLDAAERDKADINQLLTDTLAILRHSLPDGCAIETALTPLPAVVCYPGQLNQLFLNVLRNAADALGESGNIRVRTCVRDDGRLQVVISDDGVGIPPEALPRVFDPGFTTKGVGVGTGLGLSICYQIAKDHDGDITIASEPGRGTDVTLVLGP